MSKSSFGSYCSLTSSSKKERSLPRPQAGLQQLLGPRRGLLEQVHRGEDVEEHPECEEVANLFRTDAGHALDLLDDLAVAGAHDLAHLLVVAVRVGLHLGAETATVL